MIKNLVELSLFSASLILSGCKTQMGLGSSGEVAARYAEQRVCTYNDAPYAVMNWREFRPFRVWIPSGVEPKCCYLDDGLMEVLMPDTDIPVMMRVLDKSAGEIEGLIAYYQSDFNKGTDFRNECRRDDVWYMEKSYSDRRMLMDMSVSPFDERTLRCFCELDSGDSLLFFADVASNAVDSVCEYVWRLARNMKYENKCVDAFNCTHLMPRVADMRPPEKLQWRETGSDIGRWEWKSLRGLQVFLPATLDVIRCGIDEKDFIFDLLENRHYVVAEILDYDSDVIDNQVAFYTFSDDMMKEARSSDERLKMKYMITLRQLSGVDWFIYEDFSDRRLVIEHRQRSENCEGMVCYCELPDGLCMKFKVRGSGAISDAELDCLLQICKSFQIRCYGVRHDYHRISGERP